MKFEFTETVRKEDIAKNIQAVVKIVVQKELIEEKENMNHIILATNSMSQGILIFWVHW